MAAAEWFSELASDMATEVGGGGGGIGNGSPCPAIERFIKLAAAAACSRELADEESEACESRRLAVACEYAAAAAACCWLK